MSDAPDLFAYIDYRRWLADVSKHRKASTRYFSHRWFAQAAGIGNPSFYSQVVAGKRNLTPSLVERFSRVLELSAPQADYFRHLVLFDQSTTAREKREHFAALREMGGSVPQIRLGEEAWDFYEHWWIPAIRELVAQRGRFRNWSELASWLRPPIRARQARAAVDRLVELGLLRRDEEGVWHQTHKALTSGEEVRSLSVRHHNRQMAELGVEAIERFDPGRRHVSGITVGLTESGYQLLLSEIQALRERVVRLGDQEPGSGEVFQFNIQLFPLSGEAAG